MNPNLRNFAIWVIIALLLVGLFKVFESPAQGQRGALVSYSELLSAVDAGKVTAVTIIEIGRAHV